MPGPKLPQGSHVARQFGFLQLDEAGKPRGSAFLPRAGEEYLSVNWLEKTGATARADQLRIVRRHLIAKGRTLTVQGRFAILDVDATCDYVREQTAGLRLLSAHDEEELPLDPSHAGIYGYDASDGPIADLIVDLIDEQYPARE